MKAEFLQWAGSFKVRGAYWRLTLLSPDEAKRGVVAFSSGNFAQGLAAAGEHLGIPVTIVMPFDAPASKREATLGYGATVVLTDHGDRPREEVAAERRAPSPPRRAGCCCIPSTTRRSSPDRPVSAWRRSPSSRTRTRRRIAVRPVGGGGLIGGVALAFHHLSPRTSIFAVEPEGFNGMGQSIGRGEIVTASPTSASICDGLMARAPGKAPFAAVASCSLTSMTISDAAVRRAMKTAFERFKLALEPSGAAALAVALEGGVDLTGKTVVAIASGGNVALADFLRHVADA